MTTLSNALRGLLTALHLAALLVVAVLAVAAACYTIASALGAAPWLTFPMTFGAETVAAGPAVQIGLTALLLLLAAFVPAAGRIRKLETSHRDFRMSMDDVARAFHAAHTADRAGVFTMSSEFDAVRERLAFLRDHPDLERLEPEILELAAQMGQTAEKLADTYSDEKVRRAKDFLRQRQHEAERHQERIVEALHTCNELTTWLKEVEKDETAVNRQLDVLDKRLQAILPELGYAIEPPHYGPEKPADMGADNIVALTKKPAAE